MSKFITSTVGLNASRFDAAPKMTRVEFYEVSDGVKLQPVSGHNLANKPGAIVITREAYEARPDGDISRARWAMELCGYNA